MDMEHTGSSSQLGPREVSQPQPALLAQHAVAQRRMTMTAAAKHRLLAKACTYSPAWQHNLQHLQC